MSLSLRRMITPSPGRTGAKPDRLPIIIILHHSSLWALRLSAAAKSTRADLGGVNAYQILGVAETSSFAEIKASFRKLAKQTHPDLVGPTTDTSRFVSILAAYEILSDSTKRAHYDEYLFSQRIVMENRVGSARGSTLYVYRSWESAGKPMEVVEWLRWYRVAVSEIVSEKRVVVGTGYFDVLESDFYSALHMAYYGPDIGLLDLLPDCFEAEERSVCETPEVLHLVSGRDLFGMVCLVDRLEEISAPCFGRLDFCSKSSSLEASQSCADRIISSSSDVNDEGTPIIHGAYGRNGMEDAYKDLELHVSGRVIALATRIHPKGRKDGLEKEDDLDQISIYLCPEGYSPESSSKNDSSDGTVGSRIPLGTITGLGTSSEEGSCFVYDSSGTKTHVIMKHRTLLVKHLHWYGVGDRVSVCECRCSRARLPPSKFWLFEPRCGMHDVGGWYVETFGRDKKGRTVPSQRHWDGLDRSQQFDKRLHPAMYLFALAYRTLDMENATRKKQSIKNVIEGQLFRVLHWCKKLV